jgi:hypothetical protein
VRARVFAGGIWQIEYQGGVVSLQPAWDETGKWATVVLTGAGPLRQLNQGTLPATSYYAQTIPALTGSGQAYEGLVYYWNNEGGNGSEGSDGTVDCYPTVPTGVIDSSDARVLGAVTAYLPQTIATANASAFPISGPLPSAWDFQTANPGPLPATTNTGNLQFRFLVAVSSLTSATIQPIVYWKTSASSTLLWAIAMDSNGNMRVQNGTDAAASNNYTPGFVGFGANGKAVMFQMQQSTSGAACNVHLDMLDQSGSSGGFTWTGAPGSTCGYLTYINWVGPNINDPLTPFVFGHMTVQNVQQSVSTVSTFIQGNPGEAGTDRIARICNLANIPITILTDSVGETGGNAADVMGSQFYDTVSNLLRECEATGQGMLLDGLTAGLVYVTRQRREGQQPTLTLDANAGNLAFAFEPVDDDQNTVNDMTVSRRNGATARYQQLTGQHGINTIGEYSSSLTVNPQSDVSLPHLAQWGVNLGTPSGYRFPNLKFALEFNPSLIPAFLSLVPSGRVDVTNINDIRTQMQNATIKNVCNGWTETIDLFTWHVDMSCSSYDPWRVITLAAATGSTKDTVCWLDTDGSVLSSSASQGATSISVNVSSGPRWVTTGDTGGADNFPFSINLGGYQVQVSNITGTSNPQTFTVSALPAAFASGTSVSIWDPPVLGM